MSSRFLEMTPPVSAALKAGTPVVAIETGFFMQLPYPRNLAALEDCEQALWRRDCVPCCVAVVDGKLKAGLSREDMELLCQSGGCCQRVDLPGLVGERATSGAGASAAMAIAKMAGIVPVMIPGLSDELADLDALCSTGRMVFCSKVSRENKLLYASRGIPVLEQEAEGISDAWLVQRDLEVTECTVAPCGNTLGDLAEKACAAAIAVKRKTSYNIG